MVMSPVEVRAFVSDETYERRALRRQGTLLDGPSSLRSMICHLTMDLTNDKREELPDTTLAEDLDCQLIRTGGHRSSLNEAASTRGSAATKSAESVRILDPLFFFPYCTTVYSIRHSHLSLNGPRLKYIGGCSEASLLKQYVARDSRFFASCFTLKWTSSDLI